MNLDLFHDLKNKNILVTGASRGIGEQTSKFLLDIGANVYGVSRDKKSMSHLELYAKNIYTGSENSLFIPIGYDLNEVSNLSPLKDIVNLDGIIHNAGFFELLPIEKLSLQSWNQHLNINLTSPFFITQLFWDQLKKSAEKYGNTSIVFISSLAGVIHKEKFIGTIPYVTSKMGLVGLNEVLASEGKGFNIRSNCISPGAVETKMLKDAFPDMKPPFQPNHIAHLILYYLSNISAPITGTNTLASI